jgi:DNA-binding NtrC family response regulator
MILRTLIVDPNEGMRGWIATALQLKPEETSFAGSGWELLGHLAEDPCELVVTAQRLYDITGVALLAMVRTAGVDVPFLILDSATRRSTRSAVARMSPAEVIDDWTDTWAMRASRDRVLGASESKPRGYWREIRELVERGLALPLGPQLATAPNRRG